MKKLKEIFNVSYGTKLDFNKLEVCENNFPDGINFVSRTSQNNGIVAKVKKIDNKKPLEKGQITVSLGGSYVLSSFLQLKEFYTAQNVAVLKPIEKLSERELFYYCMCITKNRFRYGAFGREANSTLKDLLIPSKEEIPTWVYQAKIPDYSDIKESKNNKKLSLNIQNWKYFGLESLFSITTDPFISITEAEEIYGIYPFISTGNKNNGIACFTGIDSGRIYPAGCITIASSGNVGETFFQYRNFKVTNMVTILNPKFEINKYIGLFLVAIIRKEKYRYSYGRKFGIERTKETKINLPVDANGSPDWRFMEEYIKSLPYSKYL